MEESRLVNAAPLEEFLANKAKSWAGTWSGPAYSTALEQVKNAPTVPAVELPCKLGNEVWGIQKCKGALTPKRGIVSSMFFVDDMKLCIVVNRICRGEWGKGVFATYEDACAAIRERRE